MLATFTINIIYPDDMQNGSRDNGTEKDYGLWVLLSPSNSIISRSNMLSLFMALTEGLEDTATKGGYMLVY